MKRKMAFEMRAYWRQLYIPYTAHVTDSEVQSLKDGLVKLIVTSRKLEWLEQIYIGQIYAEGHSGGVTEGREAGVKQSGQYDKVDTEDHDRGGQFHACRGRIYIVP